MEQSGPSLKHILLVGGGIIVAAGAVYGIHRVLVSYSSVATGTLYNEAIDTYSGSGSASYMLTRTRSQPLVSVLRTERAKEQRKAVRSRSPRLSVRFVDEKFDPFLRLPEAMFQKVLRMTDAATVCIAAQTCTKWRAQAYSEPVWAHFLMQRWGVILPKEPTIRYRELYAELTRKPRHKTRVTAAVLGSESAKKTVIQRIQFGQNTAAHPFENCCGEKATVELVDVPNGLPAEQINKVIDAVDIVIYVNSKPEDHLRVPASKRVSGLVVHTGRDATSGNADNESANPPWCEEEVFYNPSSTDSLEALMASVERAVFAPVGPLYCRQTRTFSVAGQKCLLTVFDRADKDADGILSDDELCSIQETVFQHKLSKPEIERIKTIAQSGCEAGVANGGITKLGFLHMQGFLLDNMQNKKVWALANSLGDGSLL